MSDPTPQRETWLFVGASGRVGRMVLRHWRKEPPKGLRVVAQTRRAAALPEDLIWSPLDGAQPLLDWTRNHGPIYGMFLFTGVTPGANADLSTNITLAKACLRAAGAAGIGHVLIASTSAVYGAGAGVPLSEQASPDPVNAYGRAKLTMEAACALWRESGLNITCLRIGNVVGADALMLNVADATPESPLRLDQFGDGRGPRRSYIGPATMARVLASLARQAGRLPDVINLAAPMPVTMESLASCAGAPWVATPAPKQALQNITLDCTVLTRFYSFDDAASDPKAMIGEWLDLKDPA